MFRADAALNELYQFLFHFWTQLCGRSFARNYVWMFKHFVDNLLVFLDEACDGVDSVFSNMLFGYRQHRTWKKHARFRSLRLWLWLFWWLLLLWSHNNWSEAWWIHLTLQECQNLLFCHLRRFQTWTQNRLWSFRISVVILWLLARRLFLL